MSHVVSGMTSSATFSRRAPCANRKKQMWARAREGVMQGGSTVSKTTEQSTHDAWQWQNSLAFLSFKASSSGWRKDRWKLGEIKCLGETWQLTRTFLHSSYTPELYIYYKYLPSEAMNEGHWHLEPCISGAVFSGCWWATSFRRSASNNCGP